MVDVLKTKDPSEFAHECECTNCESQLKARIDDLYRPPSDPMRPSAYFFDCPICSAAVMLPVEMFDQVETLKQVQTYREQHPA